MAFFSGLTLSCTKPGTFKNEPPLSYNAVDSLTTLSPLESLSLPADKKELISILKRQAKKVNPASAAIRLQGKWILENDSQAYVDIGSSSWVSGYKGQEVTQSDTYSYTLVDKLPQFVDPEVKSEFIVLANQTDTVYYEINGLT